MITSADIRDLNNAISEGTKIKLHGKRVESVDYSEPNEVKVTVITKEGTFFDDEEELTVAEDSDMWAHWMALIGRKTNKIVIKEPSRALVQANREEGREMLPFGLTNDTVQTLVSGVGELLKDEEVRESLKVVLKALAGYAGRQMDKAAMAEPPIPRAHEMSARERVKANKAAENLRTMAQAS